MIVHFATTQGLILTENGPLQITLYDYNLGACNIIDHVLYIIDRHTISEQTQLHINDIIKLIRILSNDTELIVYLPRMHENMLQEAHTQREFLKIKQHCKIVFI